MSQTVLFKLPRLMCVTLVAAATTAALLPGCEEPTDPSLQPPDVETPTTTATSPSSAAPTALASAAGGAENAGAAARTPAELRKAAEGGDVPSMLLLGRSHESLGQAAEAKKWYQRAADAGSEDGKKALEALTAGPATRESSPVTSTTMTATSPTAIAQAGNGSSDVPADAASTQRTVVAPLPPGDPSKVRWIDIGAVLNYADMISDGRMIPASPHLPASNGQNQVFIGRCSSRDGSIVVAAMGPGEMNLTEVTAVVRVRNKVDPGSSPRVSQAGAVAARVTADNVNQAEIVEWVTRYLQTEQRSEPIFRNGWRITISGSVAEGKRDPKPQLGTAVMIEMKK